MTGGIIIMSCDVHVILEKKVKSGFTKDVWHLCNNFRVREDDDINQIKNPQIIIQTHDMGFQNYEVFGWLAGVRSCQSPFIYPRGLPENCHEYVKKEYEINKTANCYHTPTWYNLKDLMHFADNMQLDVTIEDFEDRSNFDDYKNQFKEEKQLVQDFTKTIIDYIFNHTFEFDFSNDVGLDKYQYAYENFAENYRIIFWFDS